MCAAALLGCSDNEQGGADAAPSDDASAVDGGRDAQPGEDGGGPLPDAGHPLYRTCTPGGSGECPDIPFDGGVLRARLALDGGEQAGGCIDVHRTVGGRDLYGTCAYACLEPQAEHGAEWRACLALGGHCRWWTPTDIDYRAPGAIACLPNEP